MNRETDIYTSLSDTLRAGKSAVLCTVIARTGSGPREPGAKMLWLSPRESLGTIGGGGLEFNVQQAAAQCLESGQPRTGTFQFTPQAATSCGMICGGTMEVLMEPIRPDDTTWPALLDRARSAGRRGVFFAAALSGSGENVAVGRGLVGPDFFERGSLPDAVAADAQRLRDLAAAGGGLAQMAAAGEARLFLDPVGIAESAWIYGAGHIGQVLAPLCARADFRTVVMDDRAEFASPARFPDADDVVVLDSFAAARLTDGVDASSYLVIVTRGHQHDLTALRAALKTPARYIGMIASRRKRDGVYAALRGEGVTDEQLARVHSPIGITIGALTPFEIAISILAEMISVRRGAGPA